MRISIALSLLILAIGAMIGWNDHQRLIVVRSNHDKLVAEAARAGFTLDSGNPDDGVRVTKRGREDKEAIARQAAADFIAFAREMEATQKMGGPADDASQKKILDFMDRLMSLDAAQLKTLIAEVRATKDLKDEMRQGLIGFSIMTLANDHPRTALALFTESSDLLEESGMGKHVISSSLAKWAKEDPTGALDWVRENGKKFPDLVTDDAKNGMISGVAAGDPKLAFQLIGELGLKETNSVAVVIMQAAKTPEERTASLAALREHLATITDENARDEMSGNAIRALVQNAAKDGFEAGSQWITDAGFTPRQLEDIGNHGFTYAIKGEDTGKWVEWMGNALPPGKADTSIRNMVQNWTQNDYQAAGKWLATTPDGPSRNISVSTYAETVSQYEPEIAAQWAMTLPPGKDRDSTLKNIHRNWPKDDAAGAEAFAREHRIK